MRRARAGYSSEARRADRVSGPRARNKRDRTRHRSSKGTNEMARDRDRDRDRGPGDGLEDRVIKIRRCAAVVKGGRRFSFNALVVVGDKGGRVACGYGKANEVPPAVEKATKDAQETMKRTKRIQLRGDTIPHRVMGV